MSDKCFYVECTHSQESPWYLVAASTEQAQHCAAQLWCATRPSHGGVHCGPTVPSAGRQRVDDDRRRTLTRRTRICTQLSHRRGGGMGRWQGVGDGGARHLPGVLLLHTPLAAIRHHTGSTQATHRRGLYDTGGGPELGAACAGAVPRPCARARSILPRRDTERVSDVICSLLHPHKQRPRGPPLVLQ